MVPTGASLAQTYMSMAYGSISPVSALYSLSVLRSPMSSRFASPWKQMTRRAGESSREGTRGSVRASGSRTRQRHSTTGWRLGSMWMRR